MAAPVARSGGHRPDLGSGPLIAAQAEQCHLEWHPRVGGLAHVDQCGADRFE